jgi:hypothetical protein
MRDNVYIYICMYIYIILYIFMFKCLAMC